MADPTPYGVSYSFANYQANNPSLPLPGASVDAELANVATSISSVIAAVKDVRRSDGRLKNGVVTLESLSVGLIAGLADLDTGAAAALDAALVALQESVDDQLEEFGETKADLVHTHTAAQVSVAAISGLAATTVQAALAELYASGPQPGDFKITLRSSAASGWVVCNDGTIGDAVSGASTRANADCWLLFEVLWGLDNAYAPVSTGRGASAAADFAAHKTIGLTKMLGRALAIAGAGSGLTARDAGLALGEESHQITAAESATLTYTAVAAPHDHDLQSGGVDALVRQTGGDITGGPTPITFLNLGSGSPQLTIENETVSVTVTANAGDDPHNTMQPTTFVYAHLKL